MKYSSTQISDDRITNWHDTLSKYAYAKDTFQVIHMCFFNTQNSKRLSTEKNTIFHKIKLFLNKLEKLFKEIKTNKIFRLTKMKEFLIKNKTNTI